MGLQVVVAQHEGGNLVLHAGEYLVAPGARQAAGSDQRIQQNLDVDLDVRGIDAPGVVDEVGVQPPAGERVFDPAALREAEIAAFADHPRRKLRAVHAHAVIAAVADFAVRLLSRLDVRANAAVPEEVDAHAQDGADDLVGRRGGVCHAEHHLRLA